jgi:malate dehydrogenase
VKDVNAYVLGGHGDLMVPLISATNVAGVPISQLIKADRLEQIVQRTRDGGAEIVNLLGASGYYAPSAASAAMVEAILLDKKQVLPCATLLEGEYGVNGYFTGVPVKLGARGAEKIVELKLSDTEQAQFAKSVDSVKKLVELVRSL